MDFLEHDEHRRTQWHPNISISIHATSIRGFRLGKHQQYYIGLMSLFAIALILVGILGYLYKKSKKLPGDPPGPGLSLPFIGHLHLFVGSRPHRKFLEWSGTLGRIFVVELGSYKVVVVNGHELIKQVLNGSRFAGRPRFELLDSLTDGQSGVQNNAGEPWQDLRHFTLHSLKAVGMGRKSLDSVIHAEINQLLEKLGTERGPIPIRKLLVPSVVNSLWEIIAGQKLDDVREVSEALQKMSEAINNLGLSGYLPRAFSNISGFSSRWKDLEEISETLRRFQDNQIAEHVESLDPENPRDLIDLYLVESGRGKKSSTFTPSNLASLLNDLMFGGCIPTAMTLTWVILFLASHPEVQEELQEEIDSAVGRVMPTMEARPKMPFAIAVLMETLRKSSFFPLGIFHGTTEDLEISGFRLGKGTTICTNLYGAHHDPSVWGDPERFRPSRFIQMDGTSKKKLLRHEASLPFSFGKRSCLGELMAKELLFLYLTSIFQRFSFELSEPVDLERAPTGGFLSLPPEFTVICKER